MYPDHGRYWDMVQRHKITVFYTAPTAIRSLMRFGDDAPKKYDLSSLKVLGTVGEPINPAAWKWYFDVARICKLYDFEKKAWCDFSGNKLAESNEVVLTA